MPTEISRTVTKRTGQTVPYNSKKIYKAIVSANKDANNCMSETDMMSVALQVDIKTREKANISVEKIQDIIEETLMQNNFCDVAREYIRYRQIHEQRRKASTALMESYNDLLFADSENMDLKRDNANINGDAPMGIMLKVGCEGAKVYADNYGIPEEFVKPDREGIIHIHDKDFSFITWNCLQQDLGKILKNGFSTGHGFLREPGSIRSAASLACIAIQSSQNDMFGGQSINALDYALAPYVKKSFIKAFRKNIDRVFTQILSKNNWEDKEISEFVKYLSKLDEKFIPSYNNFYPADTSYSKTSETIKDLAAELYKINDKFNRLTTEDYLDCLRYAYDFTVQDVENETMQAMEAMVHNFNSLHCLPGHERIWVYDTSNNELELIALSHLSEIFEKNRFKAISVNSNTGKAEFKYITGIQKQDNHRKIVKIVSKTGQEVTVTDNHKMMKLNEKGFIDFGYPLDEEYKNVLSPKTIDVDFHVPKKYSFKEYSKRNCIYKNNKCDKDNLIMTKELAEFCGYYVADGSVKQKEDSTITFTVCDKVEEEHLNDLVKAIFGENIAYNKTYYVDNSGNKKIKSYLYSIGTAAVRIIKKMCGCGSSNKRVPSDILLGEDDVIKAFLNAYLSCDGKKDKYNSFLTTSKTLRSHINFLLYRLGELPYYHFREKKDISFFGYEGSLGGQASKRIGLNVLGDTKFEIPKYTLSYAAKRLKNKKIPWGKVSEGRIPRRKNSEIRYEELQKLCEKHKLFNEFEREMNTFAIPIADKIESNSDNEYVYDISVEDNENFLTEDCIYVHNSRAGSQTPFSSVNFGMDTSEEGRLVTSKLLDAIWNGLGHRETPIFPIAIMQLKAGVNYNPEDKNYDLFKKACKVSAKRLYPNFISLDASYNLPYYKPGDYNSYVAHMGCRTRVMSNVNGPEESGSRGNFAFVTLNLPMLALMADKDEEKFFKLLKKYVLLSKKYLEFRYNIIAHKKGKNFPFIIGQNIWMGSEIIGPEDEIEPALRHSSLSIGFCGLAECLVALTGKHHGESEASQELGLTIVGYIRDMTDNFTKKTHMNWSCFATPAESTCGTFARAIKKKFGVIPGVSDREYITNSNHVPVYYKINAIDKIKIEAPYHSLTNAG